MLNAFTDDEQAKLAGIEPGAEANNISDINATDLTDAGDTTLHYHSSDRNRANHTGTQTASTISDYTTKLAGTANVTTYTPTLDYHPATKLYVDDHYRCLSGVNTNTITIPTTAITLTINSVIDVHGIDFNTTTGELTILTTDCYTLMATFNMQVLLTNETAQIWMEKYNTGTLSWDLVPNSGYKRELTTDTQGGEVYVRINHLMAGTKLRMRALSSDATKVKFLADTLTNGVAVPSIVFAVSN